jgi:NAD(P)-dependent dehydrogenase (short-subunit alcohol dehydrogenase family)
MVNVIFGASSGIGERFEALSPLAWEKPTKADLDLAAGWVIDEYFAKLARDHQGIERFVYVAGINYLEWIGKLDGEKVADVFSINALSFIMSLDAIRRYFPASTPSVVLVGSDAADRPMRTSIAYNASKAAAHMAARAAARELGPFGWRVNVVAPGMTDETGMQDYVDRRVLEVRGWSARKAFDYEQSQEVVPGRVDKTEVADAIEYLLEGSPHLNGAFTYINGGR